MAASLVTIAACQLGLAGTALVAEPDSSGPSGPIQPGETSPDAMGLVPTSDPNSGEDAGGNSLVNGGSPADAAAVVSSDSDHDTDGLDSSAASVGFDGGTDTGGLDSSAASVGAANPCARLLQCCPRLLAPPLTLACIAGANQDGGSACEATLSLLADAGLCP